MNPTPVVADEVPSIKSLLRASWSFYKKHFKRLWPLFLFGSLGEAGLNFRSSSTSDLNILNAISPAWFSILVTVGIVLAVFFFISKISLYKSISDTLKGQVTPVKQSYKDGMRLFWPFILISIITWLATVGAYGLLIIPGIILSHYLVFSQFELFHSNKRGFAALLGSWSIVKGRWWLSLWIQVLLGICIFIPMVVVILLFIVIIGICASVLLVTKTLSFGVIIIGILIALLLASILLFFIPISIIAGFHAYIYFKGNMVQEAAPELNKTRKRKLVASMIFAAVLACLGAYVAITYGSKFVNFIQSKVGEQAGASVITPTPGYFTYQSASDAYTIKYPTTWSVYDEAYPTEAGYQHGIIFAPNIEIDDTRSDGPALTTVSVYLYRVSEGIKNVTDLKEEYMNAVSNRPNTTIRNIVSTSTEVGVDPAIQVSFNEINTSTTATSTTEREFMSRHIMFLRGEYAYFFSYSASPENFARYEQKVQTMFDSWNTYHFEPKFGDRLEYYDPEFGFRFKYPSGWYGVNSEPEDANILSLVDLKYQEDGTPYFDSGVLMHVLRHTGNLDRSINEIVAGESEIIGDLANFKTEQPQKVILDGLQATLIPTTYANEAGKNQRMDLVLAMKGNILYRIDFYNLNEETRSNIISSFKFEPKIAARRNFTEFSNLRFGTRISAPSDWEYTTGPDETRTFVDTFIFPWKEVDPFYGSLFVSVPDTYYVGRADYNLMTYREDSIAAWSKDYRTFKVLEKGATTTDRGYDVTYFIAEYLSAPETTDKPEKVYALQAFVGHGNVVRFLTFQDDPSDFAILKETALQVIKSLEVL